MTKSHFYTFLFFLLPLLYYLSLPITVGDLAGWTAYGHYFLQQGRLMTTDLFSVLPTKALVYPALLTLVYAAIDSLGGLELVSLFHKLIFGVILAVIYKNSLAGLKRPFAKRNILWVFLFYSGITIYFIDRPALVVLLNLLLAYLLIEKEKTFELNFFLKIGGLLFLWVNMHGSWPLLILMLLWKLLFHHPLQRLRKNALIFLGLGAVSLLNPFGYKVWPYLLETAVVSKLRHIDEWNAINLQDYFPQGIIFYVGVIIFLFVVILKLKKEKNYKMLSSPIFMLLLLGFSALRNTGLFYVVLLPFLYRYGFLTEDLQKSVDKKYINALLAAGLSALCILQLPYFKKNITGFLPPQKAAVFDEQAPIEFTELIKSLNSQGAILNDWDYGSFLMYSLPNKILIDWRNIIYSEEDFNRYLKAINGDDSWTELAKEYNFEFILLDKAKRQRLISKIELTEEWKKILENEKTILFQKKTASRP